jgi:hypothetical protein
MAVSIHPSSPRRAATRCRAIGAGKAGGVVVARPPHTVARSKRTAWSLCVRAAPQRLAAPGVSLLATFAFPRGTVDA